MTGDHSGLQHTAHSEAVNTHVVADGAQVLGPRRTSAWIRFSGIPQRPKPPSMMVAPSGISATAALRFRYFFQDCSPYEMDERSSIRDGPGKSQPSVTNNAPTAVRLAAFPPAGRPVEGHHCSALSAGGRRQYRHRHHLPREAAGRLACRRRRRCALRRIAAMPSRSATDTWHSADPVHDRVKTRDSILLTYFVDQGLLQDPAQPRQAARQFRAQRGAPATSDRRRAH